MGNTGKSLIQGNNRNYTERYMQQKIKERQRMKNEKYNIKN